MIVDRNKILKDLQQIPSVGKAVSQDLYDLGYRSVDNLKNEDPERMYERLCQLQEEGLPAGRQVDRCMLYTFRCAVYYASNITHDPKFLKWWNWKDKR